MDIITALRALSTFDHDQCNALIATRHIVLSHPRYRDGGLGAYEPFLIDFVWPVVFLVPVVWISVSSYRNRARYRGTFRNYYQAGPVVALFALFFLVMAAHMTIEYAETCTTLLHTGS